MNNFHETSQAIKSEKMIPACNKAIKSFLNDNIGDNIEDNNIERFAKNKDERHLLDREYAIDVSIILPNNNSKITFQEKALSYNYYSFRTFTIEYLNNRFNKNIYHDNNKILEALEQGEWFKINADFYLTGYANKDHNKFIEYLIINLPKFKIWVEKEYKNKKFNITSDKFSNANFIWFDYNDIPIYCIESHILYKDEYKKYMNDVNIKTKFRNEKNKPKRSD